MTPVLRRPLPAVAVLIIGVLVVATPYVWRTPPLLVAKPVDGSFIGFGTTPDSSRKQVLHHAERVGARLFGGSTRAMYAADLNFCDDTVAGSLMRRVHVVACPFSGTFPGGDVVCGLSSALSAVVASTGHSDGITYEDLTFCALAELQGVPDYYRAASAALLAVSYILPKDLPPKITGCPGPPASSASGPSVWPRLLQRQEAADSLLRHALSDPTAALLAETGSRSPAATSFQLSGDVREYLADWAGQVGVVTSPNMLSVPSALQGGGASFADAALAALPFATYINVCSTCIAGTTAL